MIRRVNFFAEAWLADTIELSDQDRGVYITICALIYSRGGPILPELLHHHSQSHGARLSASVERLVRLGKIAMSGEHITCPGCETELEGARRRRENASENGAKGGRPKSLAKASGNGCESPVLPARSAPKPEKPTDPPSEPTLFDPGALPLAPPPNTPEQEFDEIWPLFRRKVGKKEARAAYVRARKKTSRERIEKGLRRYVERTQHQETRFVKTPAPWLNAERWNDEEEAPEASSQNGAQEPMADPEATWRSRIRVWRTRHEWLDDWGPPPDNPHTLVPRALLAAAPAA